MVSKLEARGLSRDEFIQLLKDLGNDGPIYFVLPDEPSARYQDSSLVNKITYDFDGFMKTKRKFRA